MKCCNLNSDTKMFLGLGATRVECRVVNIEAPPEAIPSIMAALTPGVPVIKDEE